MRRSCCLVAMVSLIGMLTSGPAWASREGAEQPVHVDLAFEFYFGGLHVLSLTADARLTPADYGLNSRLRTRGLANLFFKSVIEARSRGAIMPGSGDDVRPVLVPASFATDTDGKWGARSVAMTYDAQGPVNIEVEPPYHQDKRLPVGPEMRRATLDPQTATLLSLAFRRGVQSCNGSIPVFDGRRRYNLNFKYLGEDRLQGGGKGIYSGPALRCRLVYERIAGFDEEYAREKGDGREHAVTLWIASFEEGRFQLPVKMMADTRFGKALGHLSALQFSSNPVQVTSRRE